MRFGFRSLEWVFVFTFALLISTKPDSYNTPKPYSLEESAVRTGLQHNFYRHSCPEAEHIIKTTIDEMSSNYSGIAPALIRLVFHDCFVEGCDASVLLESVEGFKSEKESTPNFGSLRGYDIIDEIKRRLEVACPETVSCADIIVLGARHAVVMGKGPFIPAKTGRRDSRTSFADVADKNLPTPNDDIYTMIDRFKAKGFTEKEMVSLLGAHTIGIAHCHFFKKRFSDFNGTGRPDPSMEVHFRTHMSNVCRKHTAVALDHGNPSSFDSHYYRNLQAGKGVLFVDQALMVAPSTRRIVELFASNEELFHRDFSIAMGKLFDLNVLTGNDGEIRKECSKPLLSSMSSYDGASFKDSESMPLPL